MTDRFEVPEPSEAARRAYLTALNVEPGTLGSVLAAAYAQDVPAIVRAEVERALRKRQEDPLGFGIAAYLAARFGEAAPKTATADLARIGTDFDVSAAMKVSRQFAAERDFLRALARKELCAESHPNYAGYEQDAMEAACRVVEEAK